MPCQEVPKHRDNNVCSRIRIVTGTGTAWYYVLQVVLGARSRSTEIIISVVPSYGAIWSVCAHKADPETGKRKKVSKEK
jgi:hypothetical protein